MNYQQSVEALYELGVELHGAPRKFDLAHMRVLAAALGDPQTQFKCVLIAGTNGKGSTAATLASILCAAGRKTALYTSPHLLRVNERIQINGEEIPDSTFAVLFERVQSIGEKLVADGALPMKPSFFEVLTAMAFLHFAQEKVDIAVLEVGLGGRLDATNITVPMVSVISDIDLDHQQYLGNTIGEIAKEKCGILRKDGVMVTLPQHPKANEAIGQAAVELGCKAVSAAEFMPNMTPGGIQTPQQINRLDSAHPNRANQPYFVRNRYFLDVIGEDILIESPMLGRHQVRNIALAIATAVELDKLGIAVTPSAISDGVRNTQWPGRFQFFPSASFKSGNWPDVILDVAHNPAGAWALRSALSEYVGDRPITMVFGAMKDKSIGEMAEILFPLAKRVVLTEADNPRAATADEIREAAHRMEVEFVDTTQLRVALEGAREIAMENVNGVIVVTGSVFLVGEALGILSSQ